MTHHPIAVYLDIANLDDPTERRQRLADIVDPDVTYTDAHAPDIIRGVDALADFLTTFHQHVPGKHFAAAHHAEHFHHAYRQAWTLIDTNTNEPFSAGTFTGTTNDDGQLDVILGFIDQQPEAVSGRR